MSAQCDYCDFCQLCGDAINYMCEDGCESYCQLCEAFCETNQVVSDNFAFSKCVASGQIIGPPRQENGIDTTSWFTRNTWNEAIDFINSMYDKGDYKNAEDHKISRNTSDNFMTFDEYKRVADTINFQYNNNIAKNAVIYSQYFSDLENAISNMNYISDQCDTCNATCNICESCESCDDECEIDCEDYYCDYCDYCDSGCCEEDD